jgi:ATP-dependent DNA helicase RecG
MMVIFDAKRFGLSTLHQLRGRVGRNDLQSYCILISDKEKERLKIMTETNDGFKISEEDFRLRGQGDLFGVKQSGDMTFKIADLKKDFKILMQAKEDAEIFMKNNLMDRYPHIKRAIEGSFNLD